MTESDERPAVDGDESTAADTGSTAGTARRATIRTSHADAATAGLVADALRPDNTASIDTRVDGDRVVTTIAREATGSLQSTADDYVVNTTVAAQCTTDPDAAPDGGGGSTHDETRTTHDTHHE
jgi:hypothetical protein